MHSSILAWGIPQTEATVHGVGKGQTRLKEFLPEQGVSVGCDPSLHHDCVLGVWSVLVGGFPC